MYVGFQWTSHLLVSTALLSITESRTIILSGCYRFANTAIYSLPELGGASESPLISTDQRSGLLAGGVRRQ